MIKKLVILGLLWLCPVAFAQDQSIPCCGSMAVSGGGGGAGNPGSPPTVASGCYTGNATDDRQITIGFQPANVFLVKEQPAGGDNNLAIYRTANFVGDNSCAIQNTTTQCEGNQIQSFNSTGFVIGTHSNVNDNLDSYCWLAFAEPANANFMEYGQYTGDGTNTKEIATTNVPSVVWVIGEVGTGFACRWNFRTPEMPTGSADVFDSGCGLTGLETNTIRAILSVDDGDSVNGFKVGIGGSQTGANESGVTFNYWVFYDQPSKQWMDHGDYIGDESTTWPVTTSCNEVLAIYHGSGPVMPSSRLDDFYRYLPMVINTDWATNGSPGHNEGVQPLTGNTGTVTFLDDNGVGTWDATRGSWPFYWLAFCSP